MALAFLTACGDGGLASSTCKPEVDRAVRAEDQARQKGWDLDTCERNLSSCEQRERLAEQARAASDTSTVDEAPAADEAAVEPEFSDADLVYQEVYALRDAARRCVNSGQPVVEAKKPGLATVLAADAIMELGGDHKQYMKDNAVFAEGSVYTSDDAAKAQGFFKLLDENDIVPVVVIKDKTSPVNAVFFNKAGERTLVFYATSSVQQEECELDDEGNPTQKGCVIPPVKQPAEGEEVSEDAAVPTRNVTYYTPNFDLGNFDMIEQEMLPATADGDVPDGDEPPALPAEGTYVFFEDRFSTVEPTQGVHFSAPSETSFRVLRKSAASEIRVPQNPCPAPALKP